MISFFRAPIKNITPEAQVSILQIYKYIIGGYAQDVTNRLRSIADKAESRRYKSEMFDYVTFSGCFSTRRTGGLIEHSGFLCFDIDKIETEEKLQNIKSKLINDEELHTVLLFRSPSGNGLKWVVEVPDRYSLRSCQQTTDNRQRSTVDCKQNLSPDGDCRPLTVDCRQSNIDVIVKNHRVLYERIRGYLFEQYGIETDHTSDIARPCYLCYDPDAYYDCPTFRANPASRFLKSTIEKQSTKNYKPSTLNYKTNYYEDIEKLVQQIETRRIDITNDYHNWMLVAMALASTYGHSGECYFHRISQFHPKYNHKETQKLYQSCLRNNNGAVGIGTIVYLIHNY